MMHVKDECPYCHCSFIEHEERTHRYSDDYFFEKRIFSCGCIVTYNTKTEKHECLGECENDVDLQKQKKEKSKKRKQARIKFLKFIDELDVDEDWKINIKLLISSGGGFIPHDE